LADNQVNNYFGDITNFFLKAKREENIVIDENKKAELRGSLMNEIAKTKGLQVQDANIENPEIVSQSPVFNPTPAIAMAGMAPVVNIQENIAPVAPVAPIESIAPTEPVTPVTPTTPVTTPETAPITQTSNLADQQAPRPGTEVASKAETQISQPTPQPTYEPVYVQPQQQVETGYTYEQNIPAQTIAPETVQPTPPVITMESAVTPIVNSTPEPITNPIVEPVATTNPAILAMPIVAAIPVESTQVPQQPIQPIQPIQPEQFSEVIGPAYMRSPIKTAQEEQQAQSLPAYEEDYEDDEETFQDKFFDFWYQWQKRLVTIPLALFTLVAIVYAATNLDFTFKKDNIITPKSNTAVQENISTDSKNIQPENTTDEHAESQTDSRTESTKATEITAIEKTNESDNATIDPVENYQTTTQEPLRSLTKIPGTNSEPTSTTSQTNILTEPKTTTTPTTPTVPTTPPTTTQESQVETVTTQPTTQNDIQTTQPNEPVEPTTPPLPTTNTPAQTPESESGIQTYNQSLDTPLPTQIPQPDKAISDQQPEATITPEVNTQPIITPEPETNSAFSNISADEFANEIPQNSTQTILPTRDIEAEIEKRTDEAEKQEIPITADEVITDSNAFATNYAVQEPLSSQAESETIFIREDSATYPIYYYRDSTLTSDPDFDKEILDKISNRQGPESISVYYLSETQVLVEVKEGDLSKWYLFTKVGDLWTIQKYEKGM
jgi:hypothetical protein